MQVWNRNVSAAKNILGILLAAAQNLLRAPSLCRPPRPRNPLEADLQEEQEGLLAAVAAELEEADAINLQEPQQEAE